MERISSEYCPFCGAQNGHFFTMEECMHRLVKKGYPVTDQVTRLNSEPVLGTGVHSQRGG